MKISELSERSGIPVPTLKFYIREGMLPRGEATSATSAEYDDEHLARLRVIAALAGVRGLPLARVRDILDLIDDPLDDPRETTRRAVNALPPYDHVSDGRTADDDGRARAAIEAAGLTYDPRFAAVRQLETAIRAVQDAGLPWDEPTLHRYADAMRAVALSEVQPIAEIPREQATAYAVLGTALYEPVMLALRRLAHQHLLVTGQVPAPGSATPADSAPSAAAATTAPPVAVTTVSGTTVTTPPAGAPPDPGAPRTSTSDTAAPRPSAPGGAAPEERALA